MLRRITLALGLLVVVQSSIAFAVPTNSQALAAQSNQIFIPLIRNEQPPTPPPPPQANAVTVKSSRSYIQNDTRYLVGEVVNTTASKVFDVRIRASFYDANQQLIATQDVYAEATGVAPGAVSPFKTPVFGGNQPNLRYELEVTYAASQTYNYRSLTVVSQQSRLLSGTDVYGDVRNDTSEVLIGAYVIITFYDAVGNVVDVSHGPAGINRIVPGQTVGYVVAAGYDIPFASFSVLANGKVGQ